MSKISQLTALTGASLANGDLFPVTDVGSPNVSKSITADELAQGSQFSGRYKPLASDRLWIPANAFGVTVNSPSFGTLGNAGLSIQRQDALLYDASAQEGASATVIIPPSWATANIFYWWSNAGAGSGDVRWRVTYLAYADGETTDAATDFAATVTAPLQYVVKRSAGPTAASVVAGEVLRIHVQRLATEAADTLGNDAGLIGVELVRAS